jgi:sterol desaturase/sphingolipid hydroxylase (fatty acid hydroxylase superfamily)
LRLAGLAAALGLALIVQRLRPLGPNLRWRAANVGLWLVNTTITAALCGACTTTAADWAATAKLGLLNVAPLPAWGATAITILALDFTSYLWHRANHRLPFLWRFHRVHHSDTSFSVSTAARFHPGEILMSLPVRLLAVILVGAPASAVIIFEVVFAFANFFEHGNITLPLHLERRVATLFVTPALHRRHHAARQPDLDRNFGTIFTLWDRTLATFTASSSAESFPIGLPDHPPACSLAEALRLPLSRP